MAKLYFRHGAMNSGKSTALLQVAYNYEERGMNVFLIKPSLDLKANDQISSRLGMTRTVDKLISKEDNIIQIIDKRLVEQKIACILVDEVQFLEPKQIDELFEIAVKMNIPVICYGLRTDFRMEGFPASQRLLLIAHAIEELKTICRCGKKATVNGRKVNGEFVFEGSQIAIDEFNDVTYESLCAACYFNMKEEHQLGDFLKESIQRLENSSMTASLDAKMIIKKVLNFTDAELITKSDYVLSHSQVKECDKLIERRLNKEPIAYIIGTKGFMNYDFAVGEGVLIPRPESEMLVEVLSQLIKDNAFKGLEVGVGSGCISASLLKKCPNLHMRASDVSDVAIAFACKNAENLAVKNRLDVFKADIIDDASKCQYDFIVSNPPYIAEEEYQNLMPDVKDYEPMTALYGGKDGLYYYRKIINISQDVLKQNGIIAFEIGYDQAERVKELLEKKDYENVEVLQDLAGKDRVVIGVKNDK